ncbi:hypothetical protein ATL39_2520 [Sinobaca qinghaiensis]|uniref:Uncharacterized protein n=1 Tax=Sinobaca qinghaiensis TaxID=342944 RepID=A0A419UZN4_9BACL|nr:hypothetical protein [Sinobaca qinghaiensis]RKD71129.1 hypothetical protein ATL39_2520 [Sinobaca qinghaiensis]
MVRLRGGVYYTNIMNRHIKLVYLTNNKCSLYVNGHFLGYCAFDVAKQKIKEMEDRLNNVTLMYTGDNIFQSGKDATMVYVRI